MRWREKTVDPVYMTADTVYEIEVNLWNTSYILAEGHALRFAVSSSNFPRFSVNPNNGLLIADSAYPGTNITATNTIYHSPKFPSKVSLPIVKKSQLPMVHVLKEMKTAYPDIMTEENIGKFSGYIENMIRRDLRRGQNSARK